MRSPVQTYALGGIPRPRPTSNPEFNGVLHIHGALDRNPEKTSDLIISDRDFGEFYLRRRVVSRPDLRRCAIIPFGPCRLQRERLTNEILAKRCSCGCGAFF